MRNQYFIMACSAHRHLRLPPIFAVTLVLLAVYTKTLAAQSWEPVPLAPGVRDSDLVAADPRVPGRLFIGASGRLYDSKDNGTHWNKLFHAGRTAAINDIYFAQGQIFLLTSEGLFRSADDGKNWKRLWRGENTEARNVLALARDPNDSDRFYLGTAGGLFTSRDGAKSWQKMTGPLGHQQIQDLRADWFNRSLFIAGSDGLYRSFPRRGQIERVYGAGVIEVAEEPPEDEILEGASGIPSPLVRNILVKSTPFHLVVIATRAGILVSEDEGNHWEALASSGLPDAVVTDLAYSPATSILFAAMREGVYYFDPVMKRWKELAGGTAFSDVRALKVAPGEQELLYAATRDGLYRITITADLLHPEKIPFVPQDRWNLLIRLFSLEPAVGQIQNRAIRYANVSNWKIRCWQWASRLRALVPSLSAGKSFSASNNIDLDRGSTSDADVYIVGPSDKSKNWDFDLNWDLSELIWNSAQTSIDSRDKLMVELRENILNEVTRLYFERKRAQAEFVALVSSDPLGRLEALLRIDELTAQIDALTGAFLTKALEEIYSKHPELAELWKNDAAH